MTDLAPAQRYDHATRVELDAVPLAVIRHEGVTLADLRELFDSGYGAIGGLIGAGAIATTGPALAVHHGDVQRSFPIAEPLSRRGWRPLGGRLDAALGPRRGRDAPRRVRRPGRGVGRLAGAAGAAPTGSWIEVYVSDPSQDPDNLRTDLLTPVTG